MTAIPQFKFKSTLNKVTIENSLINKNFNTHIKEAKTLILKDICLPSSSSFTIMNSDITSLTLSNINPEYVDSMFLQIKYHCLHTLNLTQMLPNKLNLMYILSSSHLFKSLKKLISKNNYSLKISLYEIMSSLQLPCLEYLDIEHN